MKLWGFIFFQGLSIRLVLVVFCQSIRNRNPASLFKGVSQDVKSSKASVLKRL